MVFPPKCAKFAAEKKNRLIMNKRISENVWYIGTDDTTIDIFESQYPVPDGMSYNSYLILDEKTAILDTADMRKADEWQANLTKALDGRQPDYLVVHHMEPDHSALIARVLETYPALTIVTGRKAVPMLSQFFAATPFEGRVTAVKEGDILELGSHRLRFIDAPMVHWPEVTVSFDETDGALYSADGFGKFGSLAHTGFYASQDPNWKDEARRYYINIVGKYGVPVQNLLKKAATLPIKSIRPLHGPIIDDDLAGYISLYDTWSSYRPESDGILIACASIHGGTMEAARKLAEILRATGDRDVKITDLCRSEISANVADAFKYGTTVLAAASYDGGLFSPMYDFLHRLQIKAWSNRKVAIIENGSWAPSAARCMKEMLTGMKGIEITEPVITIRSRMKDTDVEALEVLAKAL